VGFYGRKKKSYLRQFASSDYRGREGSKFMSGANKKSHWALNPRRGPKNWSGGEDHEADQSSRYSFSDRKKKKS